MRIPEMYGWLELTLLLTGPEIETLCRIHHICNIDVVKVIGGHAKVTVETVLCMQTTAHKMWIPEIYGL